MNSFNELLERVSTPGDLATVLLFGSAGYLLDAGVNLIAFLEPGTAALIAATSTLGLKQGYHAWKAAPLAPQDRTEALHDLLSDGAHDDLSDRLEREFALLEKGIIDRSDFTARFENIVEAYRTRSDESGPTNPARRRQKEVPE